MKRLFLLAAVLLLSPDSSAADGVLGYYRYPALHGDTLVFAAEGDLWTVPVNGGLARRLTTHPGDESHPTISPDGEAFAEGFRRLGLGKVIGKRTWGGEIWLSSTNRLSDRGIARAPMWGVYSDEGEWLIEQHGVVPDIEVDNLPHQTFNGRDAQLEAAIEHLLAEIERAPRPIPEAPPYPDLSFEYPERR